MLAFAVPILATHAHASDDEIIVTDTRRSVDGISVPASIARIDAGELNNVAPVHPAELLNRVPGVNIHRGSGQEHLTAIRSPVLTAGAGAGSFLYLEDGVPIRAAGFSNVNGLFEALTEISGGSEVIRGPGSVLYGSNAVHGLINVLSRTPSPGTAATVTGSNEGFRSFKASISNEAVRASILLAHDDGFRNDSGFDQQKAQLRIDQPLGPWDVTWVTGFQNLNQETAGFIQGPDAYRDEAIRFTNPFPEAFRDGRSVRSYLRLDRDLDRGKFLSVIPYVRWTELEFSRHFVPGQALERNGHESAGILNTLYGPDYVLGADAEITNGYLFEFQDNPDVFSFTRGLHYDYDVRALVLAGYGQKDFVLTPETTLTIGARLEYTDYAYDNRANNAVTGRFRRVADRSDDFLSLTPKLSVVHEASNSVRIYARLARGSRAPQTTDLYSLQVNQQPGEVDIETLDSAEIGLKARGKTWRTDVAGYYMEKDNFFFRNADGLNVTDGQTSHLGVEISGKVDLSNRLSVSGDVTIARHNYEFDDPSSGIAPGNPVDTAPETLGHLRLTATPTPETRIEVEWRHVGKYFTDPANAQDYPGHDIFVLRGRYQLTDTLAVTGRVNNLFDAAYADRADFAFGSERYFPGRPRTVFMSLDLAIDSRRFAKHR
ncbi:MAG: TonB-dependent receptor [Hyphomonadaceae bacterium]|nr:TonB-dependent receptor [Hyphomonadaceae bacterium]MBC6413291.1 TonB-dependent receptor [Hyphomonadaceae bacterium]